MMHYGERQRGMRVEGITSLTSGLQIKPVSRTPNKPSCLPPPPSVLYASGTKAVENKSIFWGGTRQMRAIKIMLSLVEAKNTRVHFRSLGISSWPQVRVDTRLSSTARQEGSQDTRAIMPASCQRSLDIPFQASSRDRLQTQVIPWQTRKGEKII